MDQTGRQPLSEKNEIIQKLNPEVSQINLAFHYAISLIHVTTLFVEYPILSNHLVAETFIGTVFDRGVVVSEVDRHQIVQKPQLLCFCGVLQASMGLVCNERTPYKEKTIINFQYIYHYSILVSRKFHNFAGTKRLTDSNRLILFLD